MFKTGKWMPRPRILIKAAVLVVGMALLFTLLLSGGPDFGRQTAYAAASDLAWDGVTLDQDWQGSGTQDDPYLIVSGAELAGLAARVNQGNDYKGKFFKQAVVIDLNNKEWTPIGLNDNTPFRGTYYGQTMSILGLKITTHRERFNGLFGYLGANANLIRVNVTGNFSFRNTDNPAIVEGGMGGVVGYADVDTVIDGCVSEIVMDVFLLTANNRNQSLNIGGIVGFSMGIVRNCYNKGTFKTVYIYTGSWPDIGVGLRMGGIIGRTEAEVKNCYTTGAFIEGYAVGAGGENNYGTPYIGGVIGYTESGVCENLYTSAEVKGSYNYSDGTVNYYSRVHSDTNRCVGYIVGRADKFQSQTAYSFSNLFYPQPSTAADAAQDWTGFQSGGSVVKNVTFTGDGTLTAPVEGSSTDLLETLDAWVGANNTPGNEVYYGWRKDATGTPVFDKIYEADPHTHTYDVPVVVTMPTTTATGTGKFNCACGNTTGQTFPLPKLTDSAYTLTETPEGYEYKFTAPGGQEFKFIAAHAHAYDDWVIVTAPTAAAAGRAERECKQCGYKQIKEPPALGSAAGANETDYTITDGGETGCLFTLKTESGLSFNMPHIYGEYVVKKAPSVSEEGSAERACTVCGHKQTLVLPAVGTGGAENENYTVTDGGDSGCVLVSKNNPEITVTIPHAYGNAAIITAPTADAAGSAECTCTVCGHKITLTLPALGTGTEVNPDYTVTDGGDSGCLYTSKTNPAVTVVKPHAYGNTTVVTAPTAAAAGSAERTCTVCGHKITLTLPALGSGTGVNPDYTVTDGGDNGCLYTSKTDPAVTVVTPHAYGEFTVKALPTNNNTGSAERTCSVCGHEHSVTLPMLTDTAYEVSHLPASGSDKAKDVYTYKVGGQSIIFEVVKEAAGAAQVTPLTIAVTAVAAIVAFEAVLLLLVLFVKRRKRFRSVMYYRGGKRKK